MKTMLFPLSAAVFAIAGCSRSPAPAESPAPAQPAPAATIAPVATARTCALAISGNDAMQFDKAELKVDADCTEVTLTLTHSGKYAANMMGHNWVLTRAADMAGVATDGMKAGPSADFVVAGDARVLAHTRVIGGGESASVTFSTAGLRKGGDYAFFCSFPGHWNMMKGKLVFG